TGVPDAGSIPLRTTSDLFQLAVYLLGNAAYDCCASRIRCCYDHLHSDGNSARGTRPDRGVRRRLSSVQVAGSCDFADAFRPREDRNSSLSAEFRFPINDCRIPRKLRGESMEPLTKTTAIEENASGNGRSPLQVNRTEGVSLNSVLTEDMLARFTSRAANY